MAGCVVCRGASVFFLTYLVIVKQEELAHPASGQHLGCHRPHAPQPHNQHGLVADLLVILDHAHSLQGHQTGVGVVVTDLARHGLDACPGGWTRRLVLLGGGGSGGGGRRRGELRPEGRDLRLQLGDAGGV